MQSGKPVAVFETHERAPRVLIANSNLVPAVGDLGEVPRARRRRADDVRPDDRRLLDLHREPGDPPGHLRDVRGGRPASGSAGRCAAASSSPRGSAGWAARSRWRSRCAAAPRCASRSTCAGSSAGSRPAISTSAPRISTTRWRGWPRRASEGRALSIGLLGNAAEVLPELVRRDVHDRRRHRPDLGPRSAQRLHPGGADGRAGRRAARARPGRVPRAGRRERAARTSRRSGSWLPPAPRRSTTATRCAASRSSTETPTRSRIPGSCRPTSGRCSARARARSGGWRCRATRRTSTRPTRRSSSCSATRSTSRAGSGWPREKVQFQGLPARICWLGYGERHLAGAAVQRDGRRRRAGGPDRDRPRSPRRRLGRLAPTRDRGDARRLGRDRRLADPERAAEHGVRRELGVGAPRRRRRDGQVDPRRSGRRRRRLRARRRAGAARAERGPGDWASCATPTPAIRRRSTFAERSGLRMPMLDPEPAGGERRLDQRRGAGAATARGWAAVPAPRPGRVARLRAGSVARRATD